MNLRERYAAAERILPMKWPGLVRSGRVNPTAIEGTSRFWYVDEARVVLVDPETATQGAAFDHARVAAAFADVVGRRFDVDDLPLRGLHLSATRAIFTVGDIEVVVELATCEATRGSCPPVADGELLSPDRRFVAYVRDHDLYARERVSGIEHRLSHDGTPDLSYGTPSDIQSYASTRALTGGVPGPVARWSPDSRFLVSHRMDQTGIELAHLVQASPPDGGRPKLRTWRLGMLGEEHQPRATPVVFDVEGATMTVADCEPFVVAYTSPILSGQLWWSDDSTAVRWVAGTRGDRSMWLAEMDVATGRVRELRREDAAERIQFGPWLHGPVNVHVLSSGEVLSWSERTGWGHLELDGRPLTKGAWVVQELVAVDETARTATFTTMGRTSGRDPYLRDLCRVSLDGGDTDGADIDVLVRDDLDHEVTRAPGGDWLIDIASSLDTPAIATLRDANGLPLLELCRADATALYAAGWVPPERFRALAADGETEIWGLLYPPAGLDPVRKYPVIDDNYPGPQTNAVSVRFPGAHSFMACDDAASLAALGFATVVVDGRGTPFRGRAFQDATRGDGWLDNLRDHVAAIRSLAETRPWLDLDRIGITGGSGGGLIATRALLTLPEVYKVGVSFSGGHDDRMYFATWGELYWGMADEFDYVRNSNATHAAQLRGRLLLIHGELDDNVLPHVHTRLVDAFMAADRDVDTIVVPNADHLLQNHREHWIRRMWDYLVVHLMEETPPTGFRLAPIPPG